MAEQIKHECGVVLLRLLKPLEYYLARYGTAFYGLDKLYLLMEKQHNRGQDGAGLGCIKFDVLPGTRYMNRIRSMEENPIQDIFGRIHGGIEKASRSRPERLRDVHWLKETQDFTGELFLGHLRYATFGRNELDYCHPLQRENNWMSKNLMVAGNFNLTNVDELFDSLVQIGQHPSETSDTVTILEKIGHFLDDENEDLYRRFKKEGHTKQEISPLIARDIDLVNVLSNASKYWDGGYVVAGMVGHGDAFVLRDPQGIRPAYYYRDDEVVVAASERPAIQTALNVPVEAIQELSPGHVLMIKRDGRVEERLCREPQQKKACSFERIYFSRGTDAEIYQERKRLGRQLVPVILKTIHYDLENTLFSYIPNTAIAAFKGMVEGLHDFCDSVKKDRIMQLQSRGGPGGAGPVPPVQGRSDRGEEGPVPPVQDPGASGEAGSMPPVQDPAGRVESGHAPLFQHRPDPGEKDRIPPVQGGSDPRSEPVHSGVDPREKDRSEPVQSGSDSRATDPTQLMQGHSYAEELERILSLRPRVDQVAVKDAKLRTFITDDHKRDELVTHVYDVTYGVVKRDRDTLVVIDDSIVRGTTLKKSIVRILDRLGPKVILIVSSAPQIRYPDCYGIDMTKLGDFIAFRAAIALLKETGRAHLINEVYNQCKAQMALPAHEVQNMVKEIYKPFKASEISDKIAEMLHPPEVKARLEIVYQSIEDLHAACPGHLGDWYFTGDYPTAGGNKVANRSFIHFIEGRDQRAYGAAYG